MITHHISSIERSNTIFFLQGGKVQESGSHRDLVAAKGAYFRFLQISFSFSDSPDRMPRVKTARATALLRQAQGQGGSNRSSPYASLFSTSLDSLEQSRWARTGNQ